MIKIDVDTRYWKIPKEEAFLGVESDDKVKILQFELSKNEFCDGLNFTDCNCFINYKNEGNDTIPYLITDMEVQEDGTVTFTWEVSRGATIFKGNTFAIYCAKKVSEDGTITNEWNSRIGSFTVSKGLEPSSSITEVPEIDIISQLLSVAQQTNANAQTNIDKSSSLLEKAEGLGYLKEEYDVLEARMNQFTSLKEGATTGDAELIDGRIGYDGKVHDNIGGAIREQVSELKGDLDELINEDDNLFVKETIISGVKFVSNNSALQKADENYCVTDFIECEPNTKYCISGACVSENNVFMVFYDADKTFIKSSVQYASDRVLNKYIGGGFTSTGGVFQTESNTKYFRLSVRLCNVDTIRIYKSDRYKPPVDRIKNKNFKKYGLIDKNNITNKCLLSYSNGGLTSNDAYSVSDYIPCFGEDYITIGYNAVISNTGMAFYDEKYTYISSISLNKGNVTTYQIPDGVHYLRFTIKTGIDAIVNFGRTLCAYNDRKDVINSENIKPIENMVLVPSDVYLANGVQTDIYYNNLLMLADDSMQGMGYPISGLGIGYKRFFRPDVSAAKNGIVNFVYADKFGNAYNQKSTNISVIEPDLPPNLNVMCMGDSFTYNGKYMIALKENLEKKGCTVEYIGTITNSAGYQCQGINGKAISMYTAMDTSNPLYNADTGTLDFSNFISSNNLTMPDVLIIQFAFNDTKDTAEKDYDYIINDINTIIGLYISANPSGKVIYSLENCSCELDRDRLTVLKKLAMMKLYEQIIKVFNIDDYPYMLVCPSYMFVDRVNGYDLTNITFARGNHTERVPKYDSTHPSNDVGQLQIGDALTGYVMALFN